MKLKTIASIFNRNKRLVIYTANNGEQWISNGAAIYSLRGMPHMTPEIILRIFDIPPDKHKGWLCSEEELPTVIDFSDCTNAESEVEPGKINVEWFGESYYLFPEGRRIYTVKESYIKPLLDEPDYLSYHKRQTPGGGFVLAVKIGMELKAIICPTHLQHDEKYMQEIQTVTELYRSMILESVVDAMREVYKDDAADDAPRVDPETGEIIEAEGEEFGNQQTLL